MIDNYAEQALSDLRQAIHGKSMFPCADATWQSSAHAVCTELMRSNPKRTLGA